MAWTNLFTINTTDLTSYEDTEKHIVNKADVFDDIYEVIADWLMA